MIQAQDMLITTTSSLDGWKIQNYLGVVSSHIVAGTNIFSDIFASFMDIFGGRAKSYQKQLRAIDAEAIQLLKKNAKSLGANCIIGLKVDHDEISGGGKSMFMVTATGTAVKISPQFNDSPKNADIQDMMSLNDLQLEIEKKTLIKAAEAGSIKMDDELWDFIIENQVEELGIFILQTIEKLNDNNPTNIKDSFLKKSIEYFNNLPEDIAKKRLYDHLINNKEYEFSIIYDLLDKLNLLDLSYIEKMIGSTDFSIQKYALELLKLNKSFYTKNDISNFNNILSKIESVFKMRGEFITVAEKGLFSSVKDKKKWKCECERIMESETPYCTNCGEDIYGFKQREIKPKDAIGFISERVELLEDIFK